VFDQVYKKQAQKFAEPPSDVFRRHVWVNPFHEENIAGLIDVLGDDRVNFDSDFPHTEGLAHPAEYVEELAGLPDPTVRRVMGGNLKELIGL
jgi:predicted TIM-barrel fold metal-dependent hydrolase